MTTTADGGVGPSPTPEGLRSAAQALEEVVRAVDAGDLVATAPERAYLIGAMQTLRSLAGP